MHRDDGLEVSFSVRPALLDSHLVPPGVLPEYSHSLLLPVIRLADPGPLGPRVVFRSGIWGLRHHLNLSDAAAAVANGGAHAVVARVAAPHNDYVLVRRIQIRALGQPRVQQGFGGGSKKIYCEVNPLYLPPGDS